MRRLLPASVDIGEDVRRIARLKKVGFAPSLTFSSQVMVKGQDVSRPGDHLLLALEVVRSRSLEPLLSTVDLVQMMGRCNLGRMAKLPQKPLRLFSSSMDLSPI